MVQAGPPSCQLHWQLKGQSVIVRFDDSLPTLIDTVAGFLGAEALKAGVVLRDASGHLAFFSASQIEEGRKLELGALVQSRLGAYARKDRIIADCTEYGAVAILSDKSAIEITFGANTARLIDRRIVGADWLREPTPAAPTPPRFVFVSLKGGVGRSTALAVTAADFAAQGRRVLAIDMDMEAPGLGALLLDKGTVPEFGLIDALVENGISGLDDAFLADLVGPSSLADRNGRIDVIPAFGLRSLSNPGDVLSKLARAYTEDVSPDGTVSTILDKVRRIVDWFAEPSKYDAILVDARAGLHETTAAAVIGLGGEVFLFGLDEAQTFQGYSALFAHMSRFSQVRSGSANWLDRITMVQGKAPRDPVARIAFSEKCQALFAIAGSNSPSPIHNAVIHMPGGSAFNDVPWDDDIDDEEVLSLQSTADRQPLFVLDDNQFRLFDPLGNSSLLTSDIYRVSYGHFLERLNAAFIGPVGNKSNG